MEPEFYVTLLVREGIDKNSCVACTTDPWASLELLCCRYGGHWSVGMTLGPFANQSTAERCTEEWVRGVRGVQAHITKGPFMAEQYGVALVHCQAPQTNAPLTCGIAKRTERTKGKLIWITGRYGARGL